jgi:hypothetical protein
VHSFSAPKHLIRGIEKVFTLGAIEIIIYNIEYREYCQCCGAASFECGSGSCPIKWLKVITRFEAIFS